VLVTSSLVVAEGHAWFLKKFDQKKAAEFLRVVNSLASVMALEPFDRDALAHASRITHRFADQKLTLTDAHGLALMDRLGLKLCWSADWHMGLIGATLAIH